MRLHKLERRLDEYQRAALAADYTAGMTSTDLQRKYQLSKGSVLRLLGAAGVEMRRRSLPPEMVARVVARYEAGLTIREVAVELGLPKTTVQNALQNPEIEMRRAARRPRRV